MIYGGGEIQVLWHEALPGTRALAGGAGLGPSKSLWPVTKACCLQDPAAWVGPSWANASLAGPYSGWCAFTVRLDKSRANAGSPILGPGTHQAVMGEAL